MATKGRTQTFLDNNPASAEKQRKYNRLYKKTNETQKKKNVIRRRDRRRAIANGTVAKGDNKDIDHQWTSKRSTSHTGKKVMRSSKNRAKH